MSIDDVTQWSIVIAAVGTVLIGGVFFAYSTFTMRGIRAVGGTGGLRTMQAINRAAESSVPFMVALLGTALLSVVLAGAAVTDLSTTPSRLRLAAAALYLVGTVGVTVVYHVPHNDALARLDPSTPGAIEEWVRYAEAWTVANHVRTVTALTAGVLYALSLR